MKKYLLPLALLLVLSALFLPLVGCAKDDTAALKGQWRMISYVTLDGVDASIENDVDMLFYGNGYGEVESGEESFYSFTYTARGGKMTREIDAGNGKIETLAETYELSEDGLTLTIHTPKTSNAPGATIVLQKIAQ